MTVPAGSAADSKTMVQVGAEAAMAKYAVWELLWASGRLGVWVSGEPESPISACPSCGSQRRISDIPNLSGFGDPSPRSG